MFCWSFFFTRFLFLSLSSVFICCLFGVININEVYSVSFIFGFEKGTKIIFFCQIEMNEHRFNHTCFDCSQFIISVFERDKKKVRNEYLDTVVNFLIWFNGFAFLNFFFKFHGLNSKKKTFFDCCNFWWCSIPIIQNDHRSDFNSLSSAYLIFVCIT